DLRRPGDPHAGHPGPGRSAAAGGQAVRRGSGPVHRPARRRRPRRGTGGPAAEGRGRRGDCPYRTRVDGKHDVSLIEKVREAMAGDDRVDAERLVVRLEALNRFLRLVDPYLPDSELVAAH